MVWGRLQKYFRRKKLEKGKRRVAKALQPFEGEKLDRLITLLSGEDFSLFLEYLELTISEKLVMFSSIDLLDDENRKHAIRLQQQLRGMRIVIDVAEELVARSKGLAELETEKD